MKITSLLSAMVLCSLATGCAHKPSYSSVSVPMNQSTVANAVNSDAEVAHNIKTIREGIATHEGLRNATEAPPYVADKATDDAIALSTAVATGAVAAATPTVRDVPAIAINKSTDLAHDSGLGALHTAHRWVEPSVKAADRGIKKLSNAFIARPIASVDRHVRGWVTRYSIESYQGPMIFHTESVQYAK